VTEVNALMKALPILPGAAAFAGFALLIIVMPAICTIHPSGCAPTFDNGVSGAGWAVPIFVPMVAGAIEGRLFQMRMALTRGPSPLHFIGFSRPDCQTLVDECHAYRRSSGLPIDN